MTLHQAVKVRAHKSCWPLLRRATWRGLGIDGSPALILNLVLVKKLIGHRMYSPPNRTTEVPGRDVRAAAGRWRVTNTLLTIRAGALLGTGKKTVRAANAALWLLLVLA
jgi:hypothetical protein